MQRQRKNRSKATVWDLPKDTFALLRVCRQIYVDTALLPYKLNAFLFSTGDAFDWVTSLCRAQQNVISEIHVQSIGAIHMVQRDQGATSASLLLDALRIDEFPGLKRIFISVYGPFGDYSHQSADLQSFKQTIRSLIATAVIKVGLHVSTARPDIRLVFRYLTRFIDSL